MQSLTKNIAKALALAVLPFATPLSAAEGITPNGVAFAQVAAFGGPASALGQGMREGILAAFEERNREGGVHGRQLSLDTFDDGYEPEQSVEHVRSILMEDDHIGLIGPVGTPTTRATQPIATDAEMPFIGPFTGAGFLRDASFGNVFNVRATYAAETEAWIAYLVDELGLKNIAILYQDDGFGRVGLDGVTAALERRGMSLAQEGTYTRNTTAVKTALLEIRRADPDAVVMVGAYKPIAEFIRLARQLRMDAEFVNISFVGSKALAGELGETGEGVIISQVVPFPWDTSIPLVQKYQAALSAVDSAAEPGFVSLEGYVVGRLAIEALEAAGPNLSRQGFLKALQELGTVEMDGISLSFGPNDNQGMEDVFLTRIKEDGSFEPIVGPGPA